MLFPQFPTLLVAACFGTAACGSPNGEKRVHAVYDRETGKLNEVKVDALRDGRPDVFGYIDDARIRRIEIDTDEDGKIDRWEYYGDDQKILKVGLSRANDGRVDAWAFRAEDGSLERIEVSTKRDGNANRTEFYEHGVIARAEEDADGDGRADKWETYRQGALATVSFDTQKSGKPNHTVDYGRSGK
jgi:hypothetical protein